MSGSITIKLSDLEARMIQRMLDVFTTTEEVSPKEYRDTQAIREGLAEKFKQSLPEHSR
jgi:hypothetical protein